MSSENRTIGRRAIFKSSAAMLGGALLGKNAAAEQETPVRNVNTNSSPSTLKITDLRVATVAKPGPSPCTIVRLDTNQGVYGLGEVRDGASPTYALFLKSRLVGENPLGSLTCSRRSSSSAITEGRRAAWSRLKRRSGTSRERFTTSPFIRCWAASSAIRSGSMPTPRNRTIPRSMPSA